MKVLARRILQRTLQEEQGLPGIPIRIAAQVSDGRLALLPAGSPHRIIERLVVPGQNDAVGGKSVGGTVIETIRLWPAGT